MKEAQAHLPTVLVQKIALTAKTIILIPLMVNAVTHLNVKAIVLCSLALTFYQSTVQQSCLGETRSGLIRVYHILHIFV